MATCSTVALAPTPENRIHLFRLQMLIIDGGLLVLRNILDQTLKSQSLTLSACFNHDKSKITRLKNKGKITQAQYELLYPPSGTAPATSDMDVTLIVFLIRNLKCFGFNTQFNWDAAPLPTDVSVEADVTRLKHFRNSICHISKTTGIRHKEFTSWWNEIEKSLLRLNSSVPSPLPNIQQTISHYESCPIDTEIEKRLQTEMKKWNAIEGDVDSLKERIVEIKEVVEEIKSDVKEGIEGIQEDVDDVKVHIYSLKEGVVDTKEDVEEMKSDISTFKKEIEYIREDVDDVKAGINKDVEEVKVDLEMLKEGMVGIKKDIDDVHGLKEGMVVIKKDVEDRKVDVDNLKTGIINITEEVDTFKEGMTKMRQDMKEISRHTGTEGIFQTLKSKMVYRQNRKKLKDDMIKFYRLEHSTLPLSPLLEDIDTPLAGFYVMSDMVSVKQKSFTSDQKERTPVTSLGDLFSARCEDQEEIYLSADAGFGKTSFSKYLAITWCQAHRQDKNRNYFKKADLKTLKDFEFVFLVLLRDCSTVCSVDKMIEQQIIDKLPPTASLQDVLQREKCLIVLDRLDEWTHPENSLPQRKEQIPHRYVIGNCVILTTTRPWKLGVSNLKTRQISKQIELVQLNKESREQLEKNAIRKMNYGVGNEEVERKLRDFDREVTHRDLGHMLTIPLLLLYILCLWANKIHIGFSKHEIYRNIIEFLLSKTAKKHPEAQTYNEPSDSFVREYFKKHKFCKKFPTLIMALAELAYHSLHNEERENMLVFDGTFVEKYLKIEDKKLCLLSGILTESRTKTVTQETSKVSFSHKTVQEYFAAIFICSQTDVQKTGVKYCRNVQDVLVISRFICDMNAKVMCSLSPDLISVINKDDETRSYRTRSGNEDIVDNPLYKLQNMLLSCFKQIPKSEHIQLYVHDFFINKDNIQDIQLQQVAKQNGNDIKSVYLNTRNTSKSIREVIDSFSLTYLNSIQKLCYFGDEIKDAEINRILFPSLQSLSLSSDTWTHYEGNLRENLKTLEKLQYLYIGRITMSHEELTSVLNFITSKTLLKQIELSGLYCKEHYRSCKRLNLDLSQHSHLTQFHLDNLPHLQLNMEVPSLVSVDMYKIYLGESSLVLSPLMLNIKFVMLSEIEMPASTFERFVQVLENLPQSVRVYMSCCDVKPETKYERIDEYIKRSENFVVTDDDPENLMFYTIKPSKA